MMLKKIAAILVCLNLVLLAGCTNPMGALLGSEPGQSASSKQNISSEAANSEPLSDAEMKELYTDPDKFKGRTVTLTGKVFSDPEQDENGVYFQIFSDPKNSTGNTIVGYHDKSLEVESDDYVRITGTIEGKFSGTNAFGGSILAAKVSATKVEKISYMDAVSPALKTLTSENTTMTQHGYTVSVTKIEFAETETRFYVTVKNEGKDKFNLYSFNAKIVQDGKQYEEQANYSADYPDVQTGLLPGTTTEGIIAFPKLEQKNLQIVLEARSENYHEDFEPYTFDIPVE